MSRLRLKPFEQAMMAGWQRHLGRMQIRRELSDSSDRALAEIGLARGDIDDVARGRYRHRS